MTIEEIIAEERYHKLAEDANGKIFSLYAINVSGEKIKEKTYGNSKKMQGGRVKANEDSDCMD